MAGDSRRLRGPNLIRDIGAVAIAFTLIFIAYRFFMFSISALAREVPYVSAGIMSALIGLLSLTGAVAVVRDWLLARKAQEGTETGGIEVQDAKG
ncbi:MAG: hypothetical protein F7C35_08165 [Desulfurococcales archaeon]|nr:hypothetical protein [Desulfurococcales archaeon]